MSVPSRIKGGRMQGQLVLATWGLVVATCLLFLTSVIPAIGQFTEWSRRRKALFSDLIPILHGIKARLSRLLTFLIDPSDVPDYSVDDCIYDVKDISKRTQELAARKNLTLSQRIEANVLATHATILFIHFGELTSSRSPEALGSTISEIERMDRARICTQAALLSLGRLEHLIIGMRRHHRRTFTDEIETRLSRDTYAAEHMLTGVSLSDGGGQGSRSDASLHSSSR